MSLNREEVTFNNNKYIVEISDGKIVIKKASGELITPNMLDYADVLRIANKQSEVKNASFVEYCVNDLLGKIHDGTLKTIEEIEKYMNENFTNLKDDQKAEVYDKAKEAFTKEYTDKLVNAEVTKIIQDQLSDIKYDPMKKFVCDFKIENNFLNLEAYTGIGDVSNNIPLNRKSWPITDDITNKFLDQIVVLYAQSDDHKADIIPTEAKDFILDLRTNSGGFLSIKGLDEPLAKHFDELIRKNTKVQYDSNMQNSNGSLTQTFTSESDVEDQEFSDALDYEPPVYDENGNIVTKKNGRKNEKVRVREIEKPDKPTSAGNIVIPLIITLIVESFVAVAIFTYFIFR